MSRSVKRKKHVVKIKIAEKTTIFLLIKINTKSYKIFVERKNFFFYKFNISLTFYILINITIVHTWEQAIIYRLDTSGNYVKANILILKTAVPSSTNILRSLFQSNSAWTGSFHSYHTNVSTIEPFEYWTTTTFRVQTYFSTCEICSISKQWNKLHSVQIERSPIQFIQFFNSLKEIVKTAIAINRKIFIEIGISRENWEIYMYTYKAFNISFIFTNAVVTMRIIYEW